MTITTTPASQEILDTSSALALEALRMALAEFANEARATDRTGGIHTPQGLRWLDGWVDGIGRLAQDAKQKGLWVICVASRTAVMRLMSVANRGQFKGLTRLEALSALLDSYLAEGDIGDVLSALASYFESTGHQAWTSEDTNRLTAAVGRLQSAHDVQPEARTAAPVDYPPPAEVQDFQPQLTEATNSSRQ